MFIYTFVKTNPTTDPFCPKNVTPLTFFVYVFLKQSNQTKLNKQTNESKFYKAQLTQFAQRANA